MTHSVPLKLIYEAIPYIITIETKTGDRYRGKLINIENNMNCYLSNTSTCIGGKFGKNHLLFIRGNCIKMIILPDVLLETPILKKN